MDLDVLVLEVQGFFLDPLNRGDLPHLVLIEFTLFLYVVGLPLLPPAAAYHLLSLVVMGLHENCLASHRLQPVLQLFLLDAELFHEYDIVLGLVGDLNHILRFVLKLFLYPCEVALQLIDFLLDLLLHPYLVGTEVAVGLVG